MTREEAIKTLKENYCAMCAYGSQDMDSCDIRGCDNRDAIQALEQEPCDDAISRQAVLDTIGNVPDYDDGMVWEALSHAQRDVALLPSVTPQQRTGRWIDIGSMSCRCNECGCKNNNETRFCPKCGAKMEVEE